MSIFARLVFAHLIADFPLQTDFIWRIRKKSFWGNFLHGLIFILITPLFCWDVFEKIWVYVIILGFSHILIDYLKINYFSKNGENRDNIWTFFIDQFLHLLFIGVFSLIIYFLNIKMPSPSFEVPKFSMNFFYLKEILKYAYYQDKVIYYGIFYLISTFTGSIILYQVEKTFFKLREEPLLIKTPSAFLERALITTLVIMHEPLWIFLVVGVKVMIILVLSQEEKDPKFMRVLSFDIISSAVFAILVGLILNFIA
jgi:hypothetical protein